MARRRYQVVFARAADRQLRKLPVPLQQRLVRTAEALESDPRPVGSLKLQHQDLYRIRVSDYRIIYEIQDDRLIVLVVRIAHRRDAYRKGK